MLSGRDGRNRRELIEARASPYTNELTAFLACLRGEAENDLTLADFARGSARPENDSGLAIYTHAEAKG